MKKLEEETETYDSKFTTLTKGVNLEVQKWILEKLHKVGSILEIGCGPGTLAKKLALAGNKVKAIDINLGMIKYAINNYPTEKDVDLLYQVGSFENLEGDSESYDTVVNTFMLSELNQIEQQIFLGGQVSHAHQEFKTIALMSPDYAEMFMLLEKFDKIELANPKKAIQELIMLLGEIDLVRYSSELTKLSMILGDTRDRYSAKGVIDELKKLRSSSEL